jgi:hypothetical protein
MTGTAERMAQVKDRVDKRQRDFKVARDADRIVPCFEAMARRGHITTEEATAGQTFAHHWHGARRTSGLVGGYGEQRWSGTSAGQASGARLQGEEWPVHCAQELQRAKLAIGDVEMAKTLERIVEMDATLEDIGRAFLNCRSPQQAMAAGAAIAKVALQRLAHHYGYLQRRAP